MTPERWLQIKDLLDKALARDVVARSAFLDQACSDDPFLRKEVEALLAANDQIHASFLRTSPLACVGLTKGTRLGEYEVESLLGAGGMGEVYRARDVRLHRAVAIKVLPTVLSCSPDRLHRFEQEARAAAALNHPNILAVYQLGDYDGAPYLVSELLEGETLREQLGRVPMMVAKAMDFAIQIARGLAAAHEKGIVHRDLKPENLFVTKDGRVKILDFGLAKLTLPQPSTENSTAPLGDQTEPGVVLGTVGYISPEQVRGQTADHRADIFSFGAIAYEMLTGKRAFQGESSAETMTAILKQNPQSMCETAAGIPSALQRIVQRCLEKSPEQRFQSASDLAFALEALSDSGSSALAAEPLPKRSRQGWKWAAALAVAFALALALALVLPLPAKIGAWREQLVGWTGKSNTERVHSLAVLPLQNLSGDPEQEYFADGMTEELTTDLSKIGGLRVISRTSAMRYKGVNKPLPEIARELNVDGVIEGSVERSGNRVRITAELIHAPSDTHLWAESYQRDLRDVLTLQDEVARDIANKIKIRLTPVEQARLSGSGPVDPQAYQSYLEGRYYWNLRTEEGLNKGIAYFRDAIEKDPRYALAYAGLAQSYITLEGYGIISGKEAYPLAKAAALKACRLDEGLAEAHTALAVATARYDSDPVAAENEFKRAIELSPSYATAHQWYAEEVLSPSGRYGEAITEMKRALELDPLSLAINTWLGAIFLWAGESDEAIAQLQKTIEMDRNLPIAHLWLGRAYLGKKMSKEAIDQFQSAVTLSGGNPLYLASLGYGYAMSRRRTEAVKILTELKQLSARRYVPPYEAAALCAGLGRKDQAFQWLRKASEEFSSGLWRVKFDPAFDGLRSDPRYADLLRRSSLSQ
jgi:serine/threonine protein kinase/tetratricopeptide (TPR) repeat protein